MAKAFDRHVIANFDAAAKHRKRTDLDIAPNLGVGGKVDRCRVGQRRAIFQSGATHARLEQDFSFGQLDPAIDAEEFAFFTVNDAAGQPRRPRVGYHIRKVILALGGIAIDLRQNSKRERHQST